MTHARADLGFDDGTRSQLKAPDLCRLTILAQRTQVDLAVPLDVPVALLIPGIVDMVTSHGRSNEFDDGIEHFEPKQWVLARVGQPPLSSTLSLGEHGVKDGELLMLESADDTAPAPLFDDIMYNVASADADTYLRWTPTSARVLGSVLAAVATVAGCFALLHSGAGGDDLIGGIAALFVTLVLLIAGTVASRVYFDQRSALVLSGCALPTAFTAGLLFVPGDLSWAHTLLATVTVGATAILALRISGVGLTLFTAVATAAIFVTPAAFVGLLTEHPLRAIGAVLAGVALAAMVFAPRIAMLLAKLPLPAVPAPGTSLDPLDDDPSDHRAIPSLVELRERSERARKYLTGLVAATTSVAVGGALCAAEAADTTGGIYWAGTALALVIAAVLMFRGRTYSSAEQAVILIGGGAVVLISLLVGAAFTVDQPLLVFVAALVVAVVALVLGILAPNRPFSPPMRRAVELLEYATIAAVIPLVCWVADLYGLMRGL